MPATREKILREAAESIETYKNTNGVLMFMFGNENNYGLQWESNAIENLPVGQRLEARARFRIACSKRLSWQGNRTQRCR